MLRPSAKTQSSTEHLHGEVVAASLTSPKVRDFSYSQERTGEVKTGVGSFYDIKTNL